MAMQFRLWQMLALQGGVALVLGLATQHAVGAALLCPLVLGAIPGQWRLGSWQGIVPGVFAAYYWSSLFLVFVMRTSHGMRYGFLALVFAASIVGGFVGGVVEAQATSSQRPVERRKCRRRRGREVMGRQGEPVRRGISEYGGTQMRPTLIVAISVACFLALATAAPAGEEAGQRPNATSPLFKHSELQGQLLSLLVQAADVYLDYLARPQTAEKLATFQKNYYDALIKKGFSKEQAFQLVRDAGNPLAGFKSTGK